MSDLTVHTTLSASDQASPVIRKLLANVTKLQNVVQRFNRSFDGIGNAGVNAMAGLDRTVRAVSAQMRGLENLNKSAARNYAADWSKANTQRLNDARRTYAALDRLDSSYHRQLERRAAVERRAAASRSYSGGGRVPAPSIRTIATGAAITGAAAASAIKKRMQVEAAETRAAMFGELSRTEIKRLRVDTDKLGIRYGVGSTAAIDAAVEGLKAGIQKEYAGQFAELSLKAKAGLDLDEAATAKLMGRLTTMHGAFDKGWLSSILNAIAVSNNATAADGNEIVEAYRRSLSALTTTKMRPEDLAAFDASAISIGLQSHKAGTYMSFITSELANAKNARGQRGKDLSQASNLLGFAGRADLSSQMIANPTETLLKVYERLMKMPEALRARVANLIGQREWRDELLSVAAARDLIAKTLSEIANKKGFLDKTALQKIRSMLGSWASVSAALGLVWEKVGAGLEDWFDQITDSIISLADTFSFDTIREHFAALIDGAREGFGLKDWGDAVRSLASEFDAGTVEKWRQFGLGLAEGIQSLASGLKTTFSALGVLAGKNPADAREMGNLVAQLTGLTVVLATISPLLSVLTTLTLGLTGLGQALAFIGSSAAAVALLGLFAAKNQDRGVADEHIRRTDPKTGRRESYKDWQDRIEEKKKLRGYKPSGDPLFQPTSFGGATDFSGMRRSSDLSDNLNKFTGKVERASFINGSGLQYAALGGGSGRGLPGGGYIGGVPAIVKSVPGQAIPDFGAGRSGSIIGRDKVPSFGGGGSSFTSKAPAIMQRLMNDFGLSKEQAAGIVGNLGHESGGFKIMQERNPIGGGRGGFGWAQWTGSRRRDYEAWCKANGLNPTSDEANYGFLKHELMTNHADAIAAVKRTGSVSDATRAFESSYEKAGIKHMGSRYNYANQAMSAYNSPAAALVTGGGKGTGKIVNGVDARLQEIVNAAATHLPEGYSIKMTSGFRGAGQTNHNGRAADYQIIGPDGKPISNRGEDPTGMYSLLARHVYGEMLARYPNLKGKFAWGGAFGTQLGGGGRRDLMHFDVNGERGRYSQYQLRNMGSVPGAKYGITDKVPSSMIQNVPAAQAPPTLGPGQMRGGSTGPINIHINGSSHDPEALATLVQRRIDESMNWRTHDTASEYT
ncbi:hypothetical protein ABIF07_006324 [Bradyrhizobium elkanii]|uniref:phage tail tip lysozyme n=1 Tax=Bradyrhizobium elkanii TaxID=29448 RepID=UPI002169AC7F|nr:phage tail tip lysozyme [Bradyrhizobium elkanii]MCS3686654.1 hypothetical protein [Bradyrhizobium elkanii]